MTYQRLRGVVFGLVTVVGLSYGLVGCDGLDRARPGIPLVAPSPVETPAPPPPPATTLQVFTETATGFSTTDLRDSQDQILQISRTNELIWVPDGSRIPGYKLWSYAYPDAGLVYFIDGRICPVGCGFEVRFGTRDGERRAYLTVDYGHSNPGTLVDVEVVSGALIVTQTTAYPPGTPTLSGVVTEMTPAGPVPVEGAIVYRAVTSGWREATTDETGVYRIPGLIDGPSSVATKKDGYQDHEQGVTIKGDTRLDIQIARR